MAKFLYSEDPRHQAIRIKQIRSIHRDRQVKSIGFNTFDEKTYWWMFNNQTELEETFLKIKRSLPGGININTITL